jgi:Spy/CpxP family protein refolding chaperone
VKQSIKVLAVIFSVVLNIAFFAGYGIRKLTDRPRFAYQELDLSKEQRTRVESSRDRFLRDLNRIGSEILSRHIELIDLIAGDSVDRRAVETKFEEIHSLQHSMQQHVVEHLLEDKQIMTTAQRAKFFAILKSRIQEQGATGPPWLPEGALRKK